MPGRVDVGRAVAMAAEAFQLGGVQTLPVNLLDLLVRVTRSKVSALDQ